MSARDTILGAIRKASPPPSDEAAIAAEARGLIADLTDLRPALPFDGTIERFIARVTSERLTGTIDRIVTIDEAPAAVGRYLNARCLRAEFTLSRAPRLSGLDWSGFDTRFEIGPNEPVAVGLGLCGIAETGTIVFESSPETPTLHNFLCLHHVIVLDAAGVVPYMEDFWTRRDPARPLPRNVNFITGTSGTADIEARNVRGAHGPRFLHVILVG